MLSDVPLRAAVTVWLLVVAWQDWRSREVSHWASTLPLIGVVLVRAIHGAWQWATAGWSALVADGLVLALGFAAVLLSDWILVALVPGVAGLALAFGQGSEVGQVGLVTWLVVLALAKLSIVGGGDAKVMWLLVSLFPSPWLVACVAGSVVLLGLAMIVRRYGVMGLLLVRMRAGDLMRLRIPSAEELTQEAAARGVPVIPMLALGGLAYAWPLWLAGVR